MDKEKFNERLVNHHLGIAADPVKVLENQMASLRLANGSQAKTITELETKLHRAMQDRGEVEAKLAAMTAALGSEKAGRADDVRTWNATYNELVTRTERAEGQLRASTPGQMPPHHRSELDDLRHRLHRTQDERDRLAHDLEALQAFLARSLPVRVAHVAAATLIKLREVLR